MNKTLDKIIILIACSASLLFASYSTLYLVALLVAIVVGFLSEIKVIPSSISLLCIGAYLVASLFIPEFVFFIPLVAYDYLRQKSWFFRLVWALPLVFGMRFFDPLSVVFFVGISAISVFLSQRTLLIEQELDTYRVLRDELREESLALENRNRDLRERQDMEIHLATLNERGRIAREIHDNVGHLLTRSVLQVEALQVVHANDPQIRREFEEVGATVHEALDTVRASVHDLHDDAFDLEAQLKRAVDDSNDLSIKLEYHAENIPASVGYCFIAIAREAISNTLKHSNASYIEVSVLEQPGFYRLTLIDNGSDVDLCDPESYKTGIGLRTMEDRVRNLKGIFRAEMKNGFRIVASIPKTPPQEKDTA